MIYKRVTQDKCSEPIDFMDQTKMRYQDQWMKYQWKYKDLEKSWMNAKGMTVQGRRESKGDFASRESKEQEICLQQIIDFQIWAQFLS